MSVITAKVLEGVHKYCEQHNISITINPVGMSVITNSYGGTALLTIEQLTALIDAGLMPDTYTSVNEQMKENDYTLDTLFNIAKEYNLDITITSDNDLNVFNGETERQSTMTVCEFKEYLHYLELHIKFLDRME